jgi:putative protease
MKTARYVANTVAAYRMALDSLDAPEDEQERILREAHGLLDEAMARKRTTGYMLSERPVEAITPHQSGNSGLLLGQVKGIDQKRMQDGRNRLRLHLVLTAPVSQGDRLRLHDEKSGERISFTLHELRVNRQRKKTAGVGQSVEIFFAADLQKMRGRNFYGSLFKVDVGSRITGERTGRQRSRQLSTQRVSPDKRKVEQILDRISWKKGVPERGRPVKGRTGKKRGSAGRRSQSKELAWWVGLAKVSDLRQRLPVRATRIIVPLNRENMQGLAAVKNKIKKYHGRIVWRLPPVVHEAELEWYGRQVTELVGSGYRLFELGHCSQYGLFSSLQGNRQHRKPGLYGLYTLNLMNSAALHAARALGFQGALFSLESEGENLAAAVAHFKWQSGRKRAKQASSMQIGLYVYGRPPLFTARLDSEHFRYGQQFVSPKEEAFTLEKRDGLTRARSTLPFSLLRWQEEIAAMDVDYLFLDLSGGPIRQEITTAGTLLAGGRRRLPVLSGNFHGTLM